MRDVSMVFTVVLLCITYVNSAAVNLVSFVPPSLFFFPPFSLRSFASLSSFVL